MYASVDAICRQFHDLTVSTKKQNGQYYTTNPELKADIKAILHDAIAHKVLDTETSTILEPACGTGELVSIVESVGLKRIVACDIEASLSVCHTVRYLTNFLSVGVAGCQFDCIITNPPYVRYQMIDKATKGYIGTSILHSANLYGYFIERMFWMCRRFMILVLPREFLTSTRLAPLRNLMFANGTITTFYDYGERKMFDDASINTIIIEYDRGNMSHQTHYIDKTSDSVIVGDSVGDSVGDKSVAIYLECLMGGNYIYLPATISSRKRLGDIFNVHVGIVSGANDVFRFIGQFEVTINSKILINVRTSKKWDGVGERFICADDWTLDNVREQFPEVYKYLVSKKDVLMARRIRKFDETNWYQWGAIRNISVMRGSGKCIYVLAKTRKQKPFEVGNIGYFDGAVLCLIPRADGTVSVEHWTKYLNEHPEIFRSNNILTGSRYQFTQRGLTELYV